MPETRDLTEAEQKFASAIVQFSELVQELRQLAGEVKAGGGDLQAIVLSTIDNENDRAVARANWPMLSLLFV